jgi:hypothetical protein
LRIVTLDLISGLVLATIMLVDKAALTQTLNVPFSETVPYQALEFII